MPTPTGYPDWQRVQAWDGPILWNVSTLLGAATIDSGPLDVSRFEYLGGILRCTTGQCLVNVTWFSDSSLTIALGGRTIVLNQAQQFSQGLKLLNLGPYADVNVSAISAGNFRFQAKLLGDNRAQLLEWVPPTPVLIDATATNLANGAALVCNSAYYYAGPVVVCLIPPAASWFADLFVTDSGGNNHLMDRIQSVSAAPISQRMVTPSGYWFVDLINLSGAVGTGIVKVSASVTGAA